MTVSAYRAGVMASDGRQVAGWTVLTDDYEKVFKTKKGDLVGGTGRSAIVRAFVEWLDDEDAPPPALHDQSDPKESATTMMVVRADGSIDLFNVSGRERVRCEFYAIGCGADLALGAMEMGATAEEAIAVAIRRSMGCGGTIRSLKLDTEFD